MGRDPSPPITDTLPTWIITLGLPFLRNREGICASSSRRAASRAGRSPWRSERGFADGCPATIGSNFDGAAADGRAHVEKFSGAYLNRVLEGIGHNVPQEALGAFTHAILEVGGGLP
jgi:hypothetical protein